MSHISYCQDWFDDPKQYDGAAILDDRSTIRGLLTYNQSSETLLFENKRQIKASEALYFQHYDAQEKYNRYFFSFKNAAGEFRFYEMLLNGKIQLFSKNIWIEKSYIDSGKSSTKMYIDKKMMASRLYIIDNDQVSPLVNFEEQVLPLLADQIRAISSYITAHQLDVNSTSDQFLIIEYYNNLFVEN
jgi:hypothetical protein